MIVSYPWFPRELSPNARVHWAVRAKHNKIMRNIGAITTREALGRYRYYTYPELTITFCPPTRARRDLDNCLNSCKSLLDGISDALSLDDSEFRLTLQWGEPRKGGAVEVEFKFFIAGY